MYLYNYIITYACMRVFVQYYYYCVCVCICTVHIVHALSLSLCVCVCGDIICMTSHAESNVYTCVHVVKCWWACVICKDTW